MMEGGGWGGGISVAATTNRETALMGAAAIKTRRRQKGREMKLLLDGANHRGEVIGAAGNHYNDNMV